MLNRHICAAVALVLVAAATLSGGCADTGTARVTGAATAEQAVSQFVQAVVSGDVETADRLTEPGADLGDLATLRRSYFGLDAPYQGEVVVTIVDSLPGGEDPSDLDLRISVARGPEDEPFVELGIGVSRSDDGFFIWALST